MNLLKDIAIAFLALWALKYLYSFVVAIWLARYHNPEVEG